MKTGITLIAEERARQVSEEGWTPTHDDTHAGEEMAIAAGVYALPASHRIMGRRTIAVNLSRGIADPDSYTAVKVSVPVEWPWDAGWWKPSPTDRVRELTKAGALIAAEIDRLQRVKKPFDHEAAHARAGYPENR